VVEALGWGLLQGLWWPLDPKLVLDQMATPVPEITDGSFEYLFPILPTFAAFQHLSFILYTLYCFKFCSVI
jgi:hypothetical protein